MCVFSGQARPPILRTVVPPHLRAQVDRAYSPLFLPTHFYPLALPCLKILCPVRRVHWGSLAETCNPHRVHSTECCDGHLTILSRGSAGDLQAAAPIYITRETREAEGRRSRAHEQASIQRVGHERKDGCRLNSSSLIMQHRLQKSCSFHASVDNLQQ